MSKTAKTWWKDELKKLQTENSIDEERAKLQLENDLKIIVLQALFAGNSWEEALEYAYDHLVESGIDLRQAIDIRNKALQGCI